MVLDGFVNVSEVLRSGVYALVYRGEIVYVGKSNCMLVRIYSHRNARRKTGNLPSWFPIKGILFDEVHVQPCHPDRIDELEYTIINRYKPRFNTLLKTNGKIDRPFSLTINGVSVLVNAGQHPSGITIERRI